MRETISIYLHGTAAINGNTVDSIYAQEMLQQWVENGAKQLEIIVYDEKLKQHVIKFERKK